MFELVKTEVVPLTRRLANEFSDMTPCTGEREMSKQRIRFLNARLDEGRFYSPRWAFTTLNGDKYRVNGQHSSKVLASLSGWFPSGLKAVIDEFSCDSIEDMPELFAQFDNKKSSRTSGDVCGAHAALHEETTSIRPSHVARIVNAIAGAMSEYGEPVKGVEERARLIHEFPECAAWMSQFAKSKMINRTGTLGAMWLTYQRDTHRAKIFWDHVVKEDHPDPKDPTRLLAKFCTETNTFITKRWTPRSYLVKSIHAWNAWRNNKVTDLKYHPAAAAPTLA